MDDPMDDPTAPQPQQSPRRIMVVSPIFGGTFPLSLASAIALSNMDHEVAFLDMRCFVPHYDEARAAGSPSAQLRFFDTVREHIEVHVQQTRPELVLALAQAPLRAPLLQDLRSAGIVSALWFVEHFQRFPYWRAVAPHYDWLMRIQQAPFDAALEAAGVRNQAYLPLGATPAPQAASRGADNDNYASKLAFFGSPYQNRVDLFTPLADQGLSLWGKGWDAVQGPLSKCVRSGDRYLDAEVERSVYGGADIVLNLHSVSAGETVADFLNPRTFQVAGAGRFQLTDRRSLLPAHFTSDEVVSFDSPADLQRKVAHFLAHPEQRETIAAAARRRVLAEHTLTHRMQHLLELTLGTSALKAAG